MICSIDGCTRPVRARGVCDPHYKQFRRRGELGLLPLLERALIRHAGPPPTPDAYAIHGPCHNPLCMNARGGHIRWGTAKENQADRHRDGTANGPRRVA